MCPEGYTPRRAFRAAARFFFFLRADLAVGGFAISFWTAKSVVLKDSLSAFFLRIAISR